MKRILKGRALIAAILLLGACSANDVILPGERIAIGQDADLSATVSKPAPIKLSAQKNHTEWTHRAGTPSHLISHAAMSANPTLVWATQIGEGADRKHRITADPVSSGSRIFTIDSRATLSATSTAGAVLWSRDLTPASENSADASGGGLATAADAVYATTGFGELVALNAADGRELWRQKMGASATGAPTVADGIVYVVTRDSRAWALNADTGRILWQLQGTPSISGVVGGAGPAVTSKLALFPFESTELVATLPKGGLRLWGSFVSGARQGQAYGNVSDISGDPVIRGNAIFVGNPSGRTVALDATTGERLWTARDGAVSPVWLEGSWLFLVSDRGQLVRLNASTGDRIWAASLPNIVPVRNQLRTRDIYSHFGPILAGGRLWVGSNDGYLRGFNPVDGALVASIELPSGAATRPIVVAGTMYIVNQDGQLLAFR